MIASMQRVKNARRRPRARSSRFSLLAPLRRLTRHVIAHPRLYGPALPPVLFLVLAHVVVVPILVVGRLIGFSTGHTLLGTALVWAVLGFLPFLGLSYLSSLLAARPVRHLIEKKRPEWPKTRGEIMSAAAYAVGLCLGMFLLVQPPSWTGNLVLLACCAAAGSLHWLFYRNIEIPTNTAAEP